MYIIRVELFEEDESRKPDYNELHRRMAAKAFYRTIQSDQLSWFWLAPATYFSESQNGIDVVYERAVATVQEFWPDSSVMVIITAEIYWEGLKSASRNDRNQERARRRI